MDWTRRKFSREFEVGAVRLVTDRGAADGPVEPLWFSLGSDRGKDGTHNRAGDGNLGKLLGNV